MRERYVDMASGPKHPAVDYLKGMSVETLSAKLRDPEWYPTRDLKMPGFTYTTKDGLKQTGEIQDRVYVERTARDGSVVGHVEFLRPKDGETLQQAANRQTVELAEMGWHPPATESPIIPETIEDYRKCSDRIVMREDEVLLHCPTGINYRRGDLFHIQTLIDSGVCDVKDFTVKPRGWDDETPIPYMLTEKGEAFASAMRSRQWLHEAGSIGIVALHAKDQDVANAIADRLISFGLGKPRKYTRWQLFRSRMSMRFDTFRERLALRIAPWIRDQ